MCTFFLFVLISKLANGLNMGNKTSRTNTNTSLGSKYGLHPILSEEDYIPMPRSMRQILLKDRKFRRVIPSNVNSYRTQTEKIDECLEKETIKNITLEKEENEKHKHCSIDDDVSNYLAPVVTVACQAEIDEKSKSLPNARMDEENQTAVYSMFSSPRNIHITNRKYSLIDMRTGLKKSRFTLDLEDRLRKSKLELGFDTHLSGWKEFSYKDGSPQADGRRRLSLERAMKGNAKNMENNESGTVVPSNKSVPYYTQNCQILGLCSVGRPKVFPNKNEFEYTIFKDGVRMGDNVNNLIDSHMKKEGCPCDLCTLAYLTDMNSPDGRTGGVKHKSRNSVSSSDKNNRLLKEKIRITDNKNGKKSIEISVRSASPDTQSSVLSNYSKKSSETTKDCTSLRIRSLFKENDLPDIREIYTNPNSTYNATSIDKLISISKESFKIPSSTSNLYKKTSNNSQSQFKVRSREFSSSTMTGSFTSMSSLSTIMSYKRVRKIFQTIIEGTRTKKRTKFDVLKFKEMEELGLGKFRNNHWYPSEYKAFSIWKDMHENVQGLEGEFKKYQKTINKS